MLLSYYFSDFTKGLGFNAFVFISASICWFVHNCLVHVWSVKLDREIQGQTSLANFLYVRKDFVVDVVVSSPFSKFVF